MSLTLAIVDVGPPRGTELLKVLDRRDFTVETLHAYARRPHPFVFRGHRVEARAFDDASFEGVDLAIFCCDDDTARRLVPRATSAGCLVVDTSAVWRLDERVPLVVPEVNPGALLHRSKGIVASPEPAVTQLAVVLAPLGAAGTLKDVVITSLVPAVVHGPTGLDDLRQQEEAAARGSQPENGCFADQLTGNVLVDWPPEASGYTARELSLVTELRKVLEDPTLPVTPACVTVPVAAGHGHTVRLTFDRPLGATEVRNLLADAPGVRLFPDDCPPPSPLRAVGTDPVFVGRVRNDIAHPGAVNLWVVGDGARKGAALNALQIAELLV